jgi:hypothetical protein
MAAVHRRALLRRSPLPPNSRRAVVLLVKGGQWAILSPEMEHWTGTPFCRFSINTVVFDIDRRACSIFFKSPELWPDRVTQGRGFTRARILYSSHTFEVHLCFEQLSNRGRSSQLETRAILES